MYFYLLGNSKAIIKKFGWTDVLIVISDLVRFDNILVKMKLIIMFELKIEKSSVAEVYLFVFCSFLR